jgi:hypothetical protein
MFLTTTTADALNLFPGGSIRATGLTFTRSPALAAEDEGESETGKAHLKLKMRWNWICPMR